MDKTSPINNKPLSPPPLSSTHPIKGYTRGRGIIWGEKKNQSLLSSRPFSNKEVVPKRRYHALIWKRDPIPSPLSPVKGELEEGFVRGCSSDTR
jgi:hypothetical protein